MEQAKSLGALVGPRVRELREERGISQDRMAGGLRFAGLRWNRSMLAKLERGERGVSLEQIALIAAYLDVALAELVPAGDRVRLSDEVLVSSAVLRDVLSGRQRALVPKVGEALARVLDQGLRERWSDLGEEALQRALRMIGAAEESAAKTLQARGLLVVSEDVACAALHLWKRSLSEQRDRLLAKRMGELGLSDSARAHRGHVTRELLADLDAELRARGFVDDEPPARRRQPKAKRRRSR